MLRRGLALRTARPLIPELIRRLASLNEDAVRAKFSDLLQGYPLTANQIGFMHTNLDALLHSDYLETKELLEAPFDAYGNPPRPVHLKSGDRHQSQLAPHPDQQLCWCGVRGAVGGVGRNVRSPQYVDGITTSRKRVDFSALDRHVDV